MKLPRLAACISVVASGSIAWAQTTERISVDSAGVQGNNRSGNFGFSISADGRYVVFSSDATNLVPTDTNDATDIFVRDRLNGTTERVNVSTGGTQANDLSQDPVMSADGRFVAFNSSATNLVSGDSNGFIDVFVRDRQTGVTERVNLGPGGVEANSPCYVTSISADGRFVAFWSTANNLVPGYTILRRQVYVRDRLAGITKLISLSSQGEVANGDCQGGSVSADGRFVAFDGTAVNLVPGDTNARSDVFVRDTLSSTTERVSVGPGGLQGDDDSRQASISADGRYVAFDSSATNLVDGDTNHVADVFVYDRQSQTTQRVSVDSDGGEANNASGGPWISADGRRVAFSSQAYNLVPGDTNGKWDVFVRDSTSGRTVRVSVTSAGAQGLSDSRGGGISADGRFVPFYSDWAGFVSGDTNGNFDVFLRDREPNQFTSLCDPAAGGVAACPCGNPPSVPGRGCDNSSVTGGARLSAVGRPSLSFDTLEFVTIGERPSATSILMQGNGASPAGYVYGQGIRCVGGTIIRRLFTRQAVAGSTAAPDLNAGDPPVSTRSASKGDVIHAGESRWYLVFYRDPVVLGGCPASSTFNSTQTGQILWLP